MNLTYIVGDIHGHLEPLKKLLRQIREDAERRPEGRREVVFLGDYIDRGPSSAEVLRLCHPRKGEDMEALPGFSVVPKIGNHEWMLLSWLLRDELPQYDPRMERAFMIAANGGFQTLRSFGVEPINTPEQQARKAVRAALPLHVLERMVEALSRPWHEIGERFIAVHAGFDPYDGAPENQHLFHMLWIRAPFLLSDHDFGRIVIHGHTPTGGLPEVRPNRINVDVGSYKTGALCAAVIGDDRLLGFLHTESRWIGADLYAPHPAVA